MLLALPKKALPWLSRRMNCPNVCGSDDPATSKPWKIWKVALGAFVWAFATFVQCFLASISSEISPNRCACRGRWCSGKRRPLQDGHGVSCYQFSLGYRWSSPKETGKEDLYTSTHRYVWNKHFTLKWPLQACLSTALGLLDLWGIVMLLWWAVKFRS